MNAFHVIPRGVRHRLSGKPETARAWGPTSGTALLLGLAMLWPVPALLAADSADTFLPKDLIVSAVEAPLSVQVRTNRGAAGHFGIGDRIRFIAKANRTAYLYLIALDTENRVSLIFPSGRLLDNHLAAGVVQTIPTTTEEGTSAYLQVTGPTGVEHVLALASETRLEVDAALEQLRLVAPDWKRIDVFQKALEIVSRAKGGIAFDRCRFSIGNATPLPAPGPTQKPPPPIVVAEGVLGAPVPDPGGRSQTPPPQAVTTAVQTLPQTSKPVESVPVAVAQLPTPTSGSELSAALTTAITELRSSLAGGKPDSAATTAGQSAVESKTRLWAVVIGIGQYAQSDLPSLPSCVRDARAIEAFLREQRGVPPERIRLLTDEAATRAEIRASLAQWLPERVAPGDSVFVYYSGHGQQVLEAVLPSRYWAENEPDKMEEFIIPADFRRTTDFAELADRVILDDDLHDWLLGVTNKKPSALTVVFDCCHSGTGIRDALPQPNGDDCRFTPKMATPAQVFGESIVLAAKGDGSPSEAGQNGFRADLDLPGTVFLAACGANEVCWTSSEFPESVFTHFLLNGVMEDIAGNLSTAAALSYASQHVEDWSLRHKNQLQRSVVSHGAAADTGQTPEGSVGLGASLERPFAR